MGKVVKNNTQIAKNNKLKVDIFRIQKDSFSVLFHLCLKLVKI